jgi:hypothetical protein
METIFLHYHQVPATFHRVLPLLVASLVYHDSWLKTTLPAKHPFFRCHFVSTGVRDYIVSLGAVQCSSFAHEVSKMTATGVPAAVRDRRIMLDIGERVDRLAQRNADVDTATRAQFLEEQPAAAAGHIVDNFTLAGCAPLPVARFHEQFDRLRQEFALSRQHAPAPAAPASVPSHEGRTPEPGAWYGNFAHSGTICTGDDVPEAWMLWHFGDRANRVRLYRLFKNRLDITKRNRKAYSR